MDGAHLLVQPALERGVILGIVIVVIVVIVVMAGEEGLGLSSPAVLGLFSWLTAGEHYYSGVNLYVRGRVLQLLRCIILRI